MKVVLIHGSRADLGSIEAVYNALLKLDITAYISGPELVAACEADLAVLEGDRFEILQTAVALYLQKIPIIHLGGGDVTEGSQDDCMRHAITKLSHLHFPTNPESARRIIQMGEEPWRVKVAGEPALDDLPVHEKEVATNLAGAEDYILVVWHPNTLTSDTNVYTEAVTVANALEVATPMKKVVIGPNHDAGWFAIAQFFRSWCELTGNKYIETLPRDMYLTLLKHAKCLVGNSSSGYHEAPAFGTPVVDVGDRQKGRLAPDNIAKVPVDQELIANTIQARLALWKLGYPVENPYHKANSAEFIAKEIAKMAKPGHDPKRLLVKRFYRINE